MGVQEVASALAASGVGNAINIGVLNSVQALAATQAAILFASIGLGSGVDTYA